MVKNRLLLITIILLISIINITQNELKASSGSKKRTYTSSFIDYGITIPAPGLSSLFAEPNYPKNSEEALYATYSFSDAGITYNVEFYYRPLYRRVRVRVLVGDRELHGLFNRIYAIDPFRSDSAFVTRREESIRLTCLNSGSFYLRETSLNTETMYDALEAHIEKNYPQKTYFEIHLFPPPGLLKKTSKALIIEQTPPNSAYEDPLSGYYYYLISNDGLVEPLTIENLRKAYHQEGIKAQNTEDYEKICLSMLKAGEMSLIHNRVISDANEILKRWSKELESETYEKIRPPWLYRDSFTKTDYWNLYVFQHLPAPSVGDYYRYKFGFRNGQIISAEKIPLKQNSDDEPDRDGTGISNFKLPESREQLLVDEGTDFSIKKVYKYRLTGTTTPLHKAAKAGDIEQVRELIDGRADINARQRYGYTPLHFAAWSGCTDIVKLLISNGAEINAQTWTGDSPLHSAAERNHNDVAELLISNGANVQLKGIHDRMPLHHAARLGNKNLTELLLANGSDVNAKDTDNYTPLYGAAQNGSCEVVQTLITNGADLNATGRRSMTPLCRAAEMGHVDIVKLLIAKGADINKNNDISNRTPLNVAIEHDHKEVVKLLIDNGADINIKNRYGENSLHRTVFWGQKEMVELLISKGVDVNVKSTRGKTPLDIAIEENHKDIVEMLIAAGAKSSAENETTENTSEQ